MTWYGSRPGVPSSMLTVALGSVRPRRVYEVAESSTVATAVAGSVTEMVGGFAKRSSWTPR